MISREQLKQKVEYWAKEINVKHNSIFIRTDMKRKLGSCSSRGRLSFSNKILDMGENIIKETIIHELLHLKYPNHGKMFKMMLRMYLGETRE